MLGWFIISLVLQLALTETFVIKTHGKTKAVHLAAGAGIHNFYFIHN